MAVDFKEVLGQSLTSMADLNALLMTAESKDILHIDEAHELDKSVQTALYLALDKSYLFVRGRNSPSVVPIAAFTLLLSTTDEYALLQPLRDRMRLTLRFEFYSEADLTALLRQRAHALGWEIDQELLPILAQRSRGTPRLALRLLQACRRVCRAQGENTIALQHWQRACQLEQIDDLGLGPMERQYLAILAEGPARLNVIASLLGLPTRTVSQVTEQFLVRAGLIDKDNHGVRQLTGKGLEHIRRG
jgi:holliday junction DNA helicase RuvB